VRGVRLVKIIIMRPLCATCTGQHRGPHCACVRAGAAPVCVNAKNQYRPRAAPLGRVDEMTIRRRLLHLYIYTHTHNARYGIRIILLLLKVPLYILYARILYILCACITSTSVEMTQLSYSRPSRRPYTRIYT